MKLVVTPKPMIGESLMGYVLHLTEANAYPSTSYIVSALNGRWYGTSVGRLDAAPLAAIAKLDALDVERLTMLPEGMPRAFVRVFGHDLPSYEVNSRAPKVCPCCLKEGRRCEVFWELAQAAACPQHGVRLVSACPDCARPLRWARTKVRECRCGSDLSAWPAEAVSPQLRSLMALMRHITYGEALQTTAPAELTHLAHLNLRQLCKLIWVMAYVVRETVRNSSRSKARRSYRQELSKVAELLSDWPNNFRLFLEHRYQDIVSGCKPLPPFHSSFSWVTNALIKNVEGGQAAYGFLTQEVARFGARHWTRTAVGTVLDPDVSANLAFRWGTHGEACQLLGLHLLTLKKAIAAGEIRTKRVVGRGARAMVIDLDHARTLQQSQHPAISVRDAAKEVGVSIETLKAMCDAGIYQRTYRPSFPGTLTVEDISDLATRLQLLMERKRQVKTAGVVGLDEGFYALSVSPAEKASVFAWLLENPSLVVAVFRRALAWDACRWLSWNSRSF